MRTACKKAYVLRNIGAINLKPRNLPNGKLRGFRQPYSVLRSTEYGCRKFWNFLNNPPLVNLYIQATHKACASSDCTSSMTEGWHCQEKLAQYDGKYSSKTCARHCKAEQAVTCLLTAYKRALQKILCKSKSGQTIGGLQSKRNMGFTLNSHAPAGWDGMRAEGVNSVSASGKKI